MARDFQNTRLSQEERKRQEKLRDRLQRLIARLIQKNQENTLFYNCVFSLHMESMQQTENTTEWVKRWQQGLSQNHQIFLQTADEVRFTKKHTGVPDCPLQLMVELFEFVEKDLDVPRDIDRLQGARSPIPQPQVVGAVPSASGLGGVAHGVAGGNGRPLSLSDSAPNLIVPTKNTINQILSDITSICNTYIKNHPEHKHKVVGSLYTQKKTQISQILESCRALQTRMQSTICRVSSEELPNIIDVDMVKLIGKLIFAFRINTGRRTGGGCLSIFASPTSWSNNAFLELVEYCKTLQKKNSVFANFSERCSTYFDEASNKKHSQHILDECIPSLASR